MGGVNGYPDTPVKHDDAIDDATTKGKAHMKAKKANMRAVAYYTMVRKSFILMAVINNTKTVEWLGGLAWKINESFINN